jgi:hypothetical protein
MPSLQFGNGRAAIEGALMKYGFQLGGRHALGGFGESLHPVLGRLNETIEYFYSIVIKHDCFLMGCQGSPASDSRWTLWAETSVRYPTTTLRDGMMHGAFPV